jgi:Lecithin:cholesterol acyltransferase
LPRFCQRLCLAKAGAGRVLWAAFASVLPWFYQRLCAWPRLAPDAFSGQEGSHAALRSRLEHIFSETGKPAIVVTLSLGATYFADFLAEQSHEWKAAHIMGFISCAGVETDRTHCILFDTPQQDIWWLCGG